MSVQISIIILLVAIGLMAYGYWESTQSELRRSRENNRLVVLGAAAIQDTAFVELLSKHWDAATDSQRRTALKITSFTYAHPDIASVILSKKWDTLGHTNQHLMISQVRMYLEKAKSDGVLVQDIFQS
ncbi:hypothetical protein KAZ57_02575 [Patescibacteria group bacterium]|nr:hypothetical protein [Patescibacteria group bacterium]